MRPKRRRGMGEAIASLICFIALLGALAAIDGGVRDRLSVEMSSQRLGSWGNRATSVVHVMVDAARDRSIEHAPLVVFSVVAGVLVLFMLRT